MQDASTLCQMSGRVGDINGRFWGCHKILHIASLMAAVVAASAQFSLLLWSSPIGKLQPKKFKAILKSDTEEADTKE